MLIFAVQLVCIRQYRQIRVSNYNHIDTERGIIREMLRFKTVDLDLVSDSKTDVSLDVLLTFAVCTVPYYHQPSLAEQSL